MSDLEGRFCDRPFSYLEVSLIDSDQNVAFHICCPEFVKMEIGCFTQNDAKAIWNSKKAQDFRQSIHDGSFRYCRHDLCPSIQSQNLPRFSEIKDPYLKEIIDQKLTVLPKGPRIMNLALDKTCNLTCPSCRTQKIITSSFLAAYYTKVYSKVLAFFIKDLRVIQCSSAGDPFFGRTYLDLLQNFDFSQNSKLKINFNTNGVLLTPMMWERLKKIHNHISKIYISVDAATKETYDKVRRGGNFKQLMSNLKFLSSLRKSGQIDHLQLDFVVQFSNYKEIPKFIKMGETLGVDIVFLQKILNRGTFSVQAFDQEAIYQSQHPLYLDFLKTLRHKSLKSPILDVGNLGQYCLPHLLREQKVEREKKKTQLLKAYWRKIHRDQFLKWDKKHHLFTHNFRFVGDIDRYFKHSLLKGVHYISIIDSSTTILNQYLSKKKERDYFNSTENIWPAKKRKYRGGGSNKSILSILLSHPVYALEKNQQDWRVKKITYICPFLFLLKSKGMHLPSFLEAVISLISWPFRPLVSFHVAVLIERKSSV